ncbi:MAG: hypothetical protein IT308_03690 [Anaerolineaceae bacterium]|nr:hypothetical protein [Anaerolineaceae bacterium]
MAQIPDKELHEIVNRVVRQTMGMSNPASLAAPSPVAPVSQSSQQTLPEKKKPASMPLSRWALTMAALS